MGADLIGYFIFVPQGAGRLVKRRLAVLEKIVNESGGLDQLRQGSDADAERVVVLSSSKRDI